jgi:plastocyanin
LGSIFIASMLAAVALPLIWIGLSGELGAARGGALNLLVSFGGLSVHLLGLAIAGGGTKLWVYAAISALAVPASLAVYLFVRKIPLQDPRPVPPLVRGSFAVFAGFLLVVGYLLLRAAPTAFPWPLAPEVAIVHGWLFLGASVYFMHGLLRPGWANAKGQLLGFLAYDVVLVVPYLLHTRHVLPEHRLSLGVYLAVIGYSGLLAIWYLLIRPAGHSRATVSSARRADGIRKASPAGLALFVLALGSATPAAAQTGTGRIEGQVEAPSAVRRSADRYLTSGTVAARTVQPIPMAVYLQLQSSADVPRPGGPLRMAQRDTAFVPSLLVVPVGTVVEFPNEDHFFHNVFSYSESKRFDLGRYPRGESKSITLGKPGVVRIYCEVHEFMRAAVIVVDQPFHAIVDENGGFVLSAVPPGRHTVTVWHPDRGLKEVPVTVTANGVARVTVRY